MPLSLSGGLFIAFRTPVHPIRWFGGLGLFKASGSEPVAYLILSPLALGVKPQLLSLSLGGEAEWMVEKITVPWAQIGLVISCDGDESRNLFDASFLISKGS